MKKQLLMLLMAAMSVTFVKAQKNGSYKAFLTKVEVQGKVTGDSSNIKIDSTDVLKITKHVYSDPEIEIFWYNSISQFNFELKNKSNETIKLIWDDASYIGTDGSAKKIFHNGVKFIERTNAQPATSIIKNSKLSDLVAPTDNVYYSSGKYGGWNQTPLFLTSRKIETPVYDNTEVRVLLPLAFSGTTKEYVFTFKVKWIEDVKKKKK
jgi:hypothetical protein